MNAVRSDRRRNTLLPGNVIGALVMGAVVGSTLLAVVILAAALVLGLVQGAIVGGGLLIALLFFPFSLPVWAAGLILIGLPGWIGLHALGWRSRWVGAAFGGVATLVAALILGLRLNPQNPGGPELMLMAGVLAVIGAFVADQQAERERTGQVQQDQGIGDDAGFGPVCGQ